MCLLDLVHDASEASQQDLTRANSVLVRLICASRHETKFRGDGSKRLARRVASPWHPQGPWIGLFDIQRGSNIRVARSWEE